MVAPQMRRNVCRSSCLHCSHGEVRAEKISRTGKPELGLSKEELNSSFDMNRAGAGSWARPRCSKAEDNVPSGSLVKLVVTNERAVFG